VRRERVFEGEAEMIARGIRFIIVGLLATGMAGITSFGGTERALALSSDSAEFREGQVFPAMIFPALDGGRPGSVADFRGKKLILHIFASW
jgi:hypothetical protein